MSIVSSPLALTSSIADTVYDGVLLVTHNAKELSNYKALQSLVDPIVAYLQVLVYILFFSIIFYM